MYFSYEEIKNALVTYSLPFIHLTSEIKILVDCNQMKMTLWTWVNPAGRDAAPSGVGLHVTLAPPAGHDGQC